MTLFQVLQCKEEKSVATKILCRFVPFLPASLPTLLFCRLAEVRVALEGDQMLAPEAWDDLVQENLALTWMANDVKIIGIQQPIWPSVCSKLHLFRNCHGIFWSTGHPGHPPDAI